MYKIMLFFIAFMALSVGVGFSRDQKNSFLIQNDTFKKRATKNELKETIGEKLKNSLYRCTALSKSLGTIQKNLAELQRTLLDRIDDLIDDRRRFRKAKRKDLLQASKIMTRVAQRLEQQERHIKNLAMTMNANPCLHSDRCATKLSLQAKTSTTKTGSPNVLVALAHTKEET